MMMMIMMMMMLMILMNYVCKIVDWRKVLNFISTWDQLEFLTIANLWHTASKVCICVAPEFSLVEWICGVPITGTRRQQEVYTSGINFDDSRISFYWNIQKLQLFPYTWPDNQQNLLLLFHNFGLFRKALKGRIYEN